MYADITLIFSELDSFTRRIRRVSCSRGDDVARSIDERRLCRPQTPLMQSSGYVPRASGFMARGFDFMV